jgi:nucleoside-diphosphate-sugar epimerase
MEHMVRTWFDRLPIVMTRPFNYTGIGQDEKFLIPKIVSHFKRHAVKIELGNLEVSRDFSDVRDVAAAYMGLLECDVRSEVFNVCSGKAVALRTVLDIMTRKTGHTMAVEVNPAFVRPKEIPVLRGSHRKLTEAIGFAPHHALEDTLAWMLQGDTATGAVA